MLPLAPLLGGVIGLAVGGAQSLILRQHGLASGAWIVATGGGFAAAGLLALLPVVRRWTPRRAWGWVPSSMAGWTAFAAVLMPRPEALSQPSAPARPS